MLYYLLFGHKNENNWAIILYHLIFSSIRCFIMEICHQHRKDPGFFFKLQSENCHKDEEEL